MLILLTVLGKLKVKITNHFNVRKIYINKWEMSLFNRIKWLLVWGLLSRRQQKKLKMLFWLTVQGMLKVYKISTISMLVKFAS